MLGRPMSAGYSGKPLAEKLGIVAGKRAACEGAPTGFGALLAAPVRLVDLRRANGPFDVIVVFVRSFAELVQRLPKAEARMDVNGAIWIAWPKKTSSITSDVTEDRVREVALPRGLVDNKVCAIDETWSGLRLVLRKEIRTTKLKSSARR
jgi:hypothetical protein